MAQPLILTQDLTYRYGALEILKGLNLEIPKGSIYGFLGPNGAGKTTTIRLLLGLLHPAGGHIRLFGQHLQLHRQAILQRVGALIETPSLYRHLSGRENLEVMRRFLGAPKARIDHVLAVVRLQQDAHRPVRQYSLGMCQRLGIALALLGDPELLMLDEPTNGLDPSGIREMRELLKELHQEHGKTIFLSSHLLSEIEKTVTHLSIIHQGRVSFQGSVAELHQANAQAVSLEITIDIALLAREILQARGYTVEILSAHKLRVALPDQDEAAVINQTLVLQGVAVYALSVVVQSLEDVFLSLTQEPLEKSKAASSHLLPQA